MQRANQILDCIEKGDLPSDELLDSLLPKELSPHIAQHFAGTYAIGLAAEFLTRSAVTQHILDIGSGTGKFCLLGALLYREALFTGVEYRPELVQIAEALATQLGLYNVRFQCENILQHSFKNYGGFFMFNPFLEHRSQRARMDDFTDDPNQESVYVSYVRNQLSKSRPGVRLVTLYVSPEQVPENFILLDHKMGGTMRFYVSQ